MAFVMVYTYPHWLKNGIIVLNPGTIFTVNIFLLKICIHLVHSISDRLDYGVE